MNGVVYTQERCSTFNDWNLYSKYPHLCSAYLEAICKQISKSVAYLQLRKFDYIRLLNKPYVNEVILRGQNLSLKCCRPLDLLTYIETFENDSNPFKTVSKGQEATSILRVGFALSKWPHLHRAYLVTVCSHLTRSVYQSKSLFQPSGRKCPEQYWKISFVVYTKWYTKICTTYVGTYLLSNKKCQFV